MKSPEERLHEARATAKERARTVHALLDATRLALQSARVVGIAADARPVMAAFTVSEIRLKLADMGIAAAEPEVAGAAEELVSRGEANLSHTENGLPAYQWWPPSNEEVA